MSRRLESVLTLKNLLVPKNNLWLRREAAVFAFVLFDYLSTLVFCHSPYEEANMLARVFMENLGITLGLTLFVLASNMPIYMTLSFDSHTIRLPSKIAFLFEVFVDASFAWFVAGVHFSGGSSWFWFAPDLMRQTLGAILYLVVAFSLVKPHKPRYDN